MTVPRITVLVLTVDNKYDVRFTLDDCSTTLTIRVSQPIEKKTIISPLILNSASSVRIPQNISRILLPSINVTPLKLSSVPSIILNGACTCNIFHSSLRIRLSPVKKPIMRKYQNPDKTHSLNPSITTCNVSCSHLNCKSTIPLNVNGRKFSIVNATDLN